jgi:hypothetical protein
LCREIEAKSWDEALPSQLFFHDPRRRSGRRQIFEPISTHFYALVTLMPLATRIALACHQKDTLCVFTALQGQKPFIEGSWASRGKIAHL